MGFSSTLENAQLALRTADKAPVTIFTKYYQSELTYLRELGREFAARNPALAGPFAEKSTDPDVERLLEGFAFLTARVRERIEDAVPQTVAALAELMAPHTLRSFPACSVVEFQPEVASLRGRHTVASGTELASQPIDGTTCLFRTVGSLDLCPLSLVDAQLDRSLIGRPAIRLKLRTSRAGRALVCHENGFCFFLHGAFPQATTLALWLDRYLVDVRYEGSDGEKTLGASAVQRATVDEPLTPWPRYAPPGLRRLHEYFGFAPRFLFFDVRHLDRLDAEGPTEFTIVLHFEGTPDLPERVATHQFRLHCAPVVNLFSCTAAPMQRDWRRQEYLLRPDGTDPAHGEVFSVDAVVGVQPGGGGRRSYEPFFGFDHARNPSAAYFWTRRALSPVDGGLDTYLAVGTPGDGASELADEVFSVDLTCTNRHLAADLGIGDICIPTARSPAAATFSNIGPVSPPTPPPLGEALHWRLIGDLAQTLGDLGRPNALASFLTMQQLHQDQDAQRVTANALRTRAVRQVEVRAARRSLDGAPIRGIRTEVELDEGAFSGLGDAALFAHVLDHVFADRVAINSFHDLTVRLHPSGKSWAFAPQVGIGPWP